MTREKTRHYFAYGIIVVTDWYGDVGYAPVNLENLDDEQVQDILDNPLQDYLSFGVAKVNYVELYIHMVHIEDTDEYTLEKTYKTPAYIVKAGQVPEGLTIPEEMVM